MSFFITNIYREVCAKTFTNLDRISTSLTFFDGLL